MDDPGLAWPFWKFGLKKDDLFTKLHDQYNTFPSAIQDPEAFHHDVFEISNEAVSLAEFHRRLADRKQQRLRELNDSLEFAAVEIIANPSLVGTEQWQYALQLFRSRSLDHLVRYFASYLPEKPLPPRRHDSFSNTSFSLFNNQADAPILTEEPSLSESTCHDDHAPSSPRSMTMCSDSSAASPIDVDHHSYIFDNLTPARSLSFSGSESEHFPLQDSITEEDGSQVCETLDYDADSVSDPVVSASILDLPEAAALEQVTLSRHAAEALDDEDLSQHDTEVTEESETPTPKPIPTGTVFFDVNASLPRRRHRSFSPSRPHPLSHIQLLDHDVHDVRTSLASPGRRRDGNRKSERGRSPGAGRVRKPLPELVKGRARGRRRADIAPSTDR